MWLALLLLLPTALHLSLAESPQERVPLFRLIQLGPWGSGANDTTGSPCQGLFATGATALNLANRSLERLPGCLPRALRSLDGSHNRLSALGAAALGHLPRLQVLTLRHNRIGALRWDPGWPAGLHTLDLSYNQLAALPPCARPALGSLRALELAGNPLPTLPPGAFACFPALRRLNLSGTALGQRGIPDAAFAPLASLEVLDLSSTLLEQVQPRWMGDLPKLTSLYLRKMPMLRSLEGDIFKMTSDLQQLDCQDSLALTSVQTRIFQDTPRLQLLLLQNCNLSSFPPWTLHSSQVLSINLFGNPLTCSCELSWLFMDVNRTILSRAADTVCAPAAGSPGAFSARLALPQLPGLCPPDPGTTLPPSSVRSTPAPSTPAPFAAVLSAAPSPPAVTQAPSRPAGTPSRAAGTPSHAAGTPSHAAGTPSHAAGTPSHSAGTPSHAAGTPSHAAGTPSHAAGTPSHSAGTPSHAAGTPSHAVGAGAAASTTSSAAGPRDASAASPAGPERELVLDPDIPAAPRPPASRRGPLPASRTTRAAPRAPHPSPSEEGIPVLVLDDSSEEEEEEEEEGKGKGKGEKVSAPPQGVACDYHPCRHLQTPCAELQRRRRCQCPGVSQEDALPEPPRLQGVSEVTDTSALVRWCAPNSVVRSYRVRYSAEGGRGPGNRSAVGNLPATARQHPLYGLAPGTTYRVCVQAANRAGLSRPQAPGRRGPCASFTTKPSSALILAGLGAAAGLLLLSTLVLSAGRCRPRPRPRAPAHLVAYRNPAFDHPLKPQTCA